MGSMITVYMCVPCYPTAVAQLHFIGMTCLVGPLEVIL